MEETFEAYAQVRARFEELIRAADPDDLVRVVPACPDWTVRDLLAHVVSLPAAIGAGRAPAGEINGWLASLVAERAEQPVEQLIDEWNELDDVLRAVLSGPAGLLFPDLVVHEHDLRGALGRPDHDALPVAELMPRTMAAFRRPLREAGLGAIEVRNGSSSWRTSDDPVGWTLLVDPWEAVRALGSRRTADELRALPAEGDCEPYIEILDEHLPLPIHSLEES
jgi:uncharacterized protein (TIGR03083 family)